MATKILPAEHLQAWIDTLVASYEVFAPVEGEGASLFKQVKAGQAPAMEGRTDMPPKGIVFKQVEKILSYKTNEDLGITEAPVEATKKVIFGIRPCDSRSFELTDKVFVHTDMPENKYAERRKETALVTNACDKACRTCFCTSVGSGPGEEAGDVWMINLDGKYLVKSLTPVGDEIMGAAAAIMSDASVADESAAKQITDNVAASMEKLNVPAAKALDGLFTDEAFWQRLTDKCLSCGACTFVCPTCYCFDVKDNGTVKGGDRYRGWDSCMFFQYNRAAGGHNPREFHWKRMRQRMLHKFSYYPEKYGDIDCVGCGRCIRSCPVSYDLRDFLSLATAATAGMHADFVDELPGEEEVEPLACDVKTSDETVKTGVGSDD